MKQSENCKRPSPLPLSQRIDILFIDYRSKAYYVKTAYYIIFFVTKWKTY